MFDKIFLSCQLRFQSRKAGKPQNQISVSDNDAWRINPGPKVIFKFYTHVLYNNVKKVNDRFY